MTGNQILVLSFLAGLSGAAVSVGSEAKPNILIIISDDQGSGDIGYNNPLVKTPVLDRLAKQSAVFTNFVSHPACTPARASFLTGRNYMSTGVWGVGQRGYEVAASMAAYQSLDHQPAHAGQLSQQITRRTFFS